MADGIVIEITFNKLTAIAARFPGEVSDITNSAIHDLVRHAAPNTPVDTGNLKSAQTQQLASPAKQEASNHWTAGYAAYVNGGTARMAARPFASSAAEAVKPRWINQLKVLERRIT